ncbi:MAG: RodZ domain-containing protein [Candidatus Omnitrophota bacterium]
MNDGNQEVEVEMEESENKDKGPDKRNQNPSVQESPVRKGVLLKNTRIEKGLSLEAVHEATKIPLDALKAIEEGYTIRTLSPFYIKGFLKIYAGYLNIDVTEVIEEYHKEELPKVVKQEVDTDFEFNIKQALKKYLTHQRKKQIAAIIGIFIVLFIFFKVIVFISQSLRNKPKKQTVKKENIINKSVHTIDAEKVESKVREIEVKPKVEKPVVTTSVVPTPQPKPEVAVKKQPTVIPIVQPVQKEVRLTIRAQKDSWLRVKADEKIVFQSTLNKGSVESWDADKEIVITGKNIINLEFEVNGKLIGALGRKNRKAKSVTITKDGLSVTN